VLQACPFLFRFRVLSPSLFDAAYHQGSGFNLCAAMVKLQMIKNTAVDPRVAEWTSFGPDLSYQCHFWENCTLAVRNHARSETRLMTEASPHRPRSKVIIDAEPWNSVLSVSSPGSFARGPEPAGAQHRSARGGGQ